MTERIPFLMHLKAGYGENILSLAYLSTNLPYRTLLVTTALSTTCRIMEARNMLTRINPSSSEIGSGLRSRKKLDAVQ